MDKEGGGRGSGVRVTKEKKVIHIRRDTGAENIKTYII